MKYWFSRKSSILGILIILRNPPLLTSLHASCRRMLRMAVELYDMHNMILNVLAKADGSEALSLCLWDLSRHGPKGGVINYQKSYCSLKIDILLHNGASKWIYSIRYDAYLYVYFGRPENLHSRPQGNQRSRPPKAADFVGCFVRLLYRCFLGIQNKKYR